ncbi:MAG TPA: hypothetical protein ENH00_03370 [Actinobacteria bacterium]|nr:hypothetical protein BMS3Bbin01_01018 [bacterium BMS3Bbin01]HDH25222.1 hypothetical protein [Actinomycetota bacterium]
MLKRVSVISSIALAVLLIAGLAYAAAAPASTNDSPASVKTADNPSTSADDSTTEAADDNAQEATSPAADDSSATTTMSGSDSSADDSLESTDPQPKQVASTGGIFPVDEAGTVEITVGDAGLELVSATPNDGFEVSSIQTEADSIDVKFRSGSLEVEFEAELENGMLNFKVTRETAEDASSHDHTLTNDHSSTEDSTGDHSSTENSTDTTPAVDMTKTYTVGDAGSVQIKVSGGNLELLDATPNAGWEITETRTEADQIKIEFRNGSEKVEFEAELDHGQLQTKTEIKSNDSDDEGSDGSSSNNS